MGFAVFRNRICRYGGHPLHTIGLQAARSMMPGSILLLYAPASVAAGFRDLASLEAKRSFGRLFMCPQRDLRKHERQDRDIRKSPSPTPKSREWGDDFTSFQRPLQVLDVLCRPWF